MKTGLLMAGLLVFPAAASAQDQIIGLLSLPEVFGEGPCDRFTPQEVTLRAGPDSETIVGTIRVDVPWTFHAVGGCEGLRVNLHLTGTPRVTEFPTKESGYEEPAAIVLQRRDGWFRVRLSEGTAWLQASPRDEYFPLEQLLTDRLTYLTDAWDGHLSESPGGAAAEPTVSGRDVRLGQFRRVGDRLWVHVEVLSHSICESTEEPTVAARGWMPAHAVSGEPAIWFFSRGC